MRIGAYTRAWPMHSGVAHMNIQPLNNRPCLALATSVLFLLSCGLDAGEEANEPANEAASAVTQLQTLKRSKRSHRFVSVLDSGQGLDIVLERAWTNEANDWRAYGVVSVGNGCRYVDSGWLRGREVTFEFTEQELVKSFLTEAPTKVKRTVGFLVRPAGKLNRVNHVFRKFDDRGWEDLGVYKDGARTVESRWGLRCDNIISGKKIVRSFAEPILIARAFGYRKDGANAQCSAGGCPETAQFFGRMAHRHLQFAVSRRADRVAASRVRARDDIRRVAHQSVAAAKGLVLVNDEAYDEVEAIIERTVTSLQSIVDKNRRIEQQAKQQADDAEQALKRLNGDYGDDDNYDIADWAARGDPSRPAPRPDEPAGDGVGYW